MSINKRQIHLDTAAKETLDDDVMAFWCAVEGRLSKLTALAKTAVAAYCVR